MVVLVALGSLCLSCHKYPEDPFISLRRPAKRIEGTWNITSYQVWGKEHSHDFDSLLSPKTLTDYCINFAPYDRLDGGEFKFVDKNNNKFFLDRGEYQFDSGDNKGILPGG